MKQQYMYNTTWYIFSVIALTSVVSLTSADYVTINSVDGTYDLNAGNLNGLLGNSDNQFALNDQQILAATLNNDGIETIGKLSFILASTDAGLSFMGLFDGVTDIDPTGSISDQFLGVSALTSIDTTWYATGDEGSEYAWYDMGNNSQLVNALLGWDHGQTSAGFAWGDVSVAQSGTFNMYAAELTEFANNSIQFITYQDDQWAVAGTGDLSVLGQYAFSYQFIPAPGAIALLAIAGLAGARRRRT